MGINFDKNKTVLTNLLIMPMNVPYMPFNPTNEKVTKKLLWDGCLFTMLRNRALEWSLLIEVTGELNCHTAITLKRPAMLSGKP